MIFLRQMLDSAESCVEAHIVAGLGILGGHIGLAAWHVIANGKDFDAVGFGTGAAAIIGAIGAAGFLQGKQRQAEGTTPATGGPAQ